MCIPCVYVCVLWLVYFVFVCECGWLNECIYTLSRSLSLSLCVCVCVFVCIYASVFVHVCVHVMVMLLV